MSQLSVVCGMAASPSALGTKSLLPSPECSHSDARRDLLELIDSRHGQRATIFTDQPSIDSGFIMQFSSFSRFVHVLWKQHLCCIGFPGIYSLGFESSTL